MKRDLICLALVGILAVLINPTSIGLADENDGSFPSMPFDLYESNGQEIITVIMRSSDAYPEKIENPPVYKVNFQEGEEKVFSNIFLVGYKPCVQGDFYFGDKLMAPLEYKKEIVHVTSVNKDVIIDEDSLSQVRGKSSCLDGEKVFLTIFKTDGKGNIISTVKAVFALNKE